MFSIALLIARLLSHSGISANGSPVNFEPIITRSSGASNASVGNSSSSCSHTIVSIGPRLQLYSGNTI